MKRQDRDTMDRLEQDIATTIAGRHPDDDAPLPEATVPQVAKMLSEQMTLANDRIAAELERLATALMDKAAQLRSANDAVCANLSSVLTKAQALHDLQAQVEASYRAIDLGR